MKFTLDRPGDASLRIVRSYAAGEIVTSHEVLRVHTLLAGATVVDWTVDGVAALDAARAGEILALDPEVVLLGTGASLRFPSRAFLAEFATRGIGCEVMDTAAACRTYNLLLSEGRRVVAALLII